MHVSKLLIELITCKRYRYYLCPLAGGCCISRGAEDLCGSLVTAVVKW